MYVVELESDQVLVREVWAYQRHVFSPHAYRASYLFPPDCAVCWMPDRHPMHRVTSVPYSGKAS